MTVEEKIAMLEELMDVDEGSLKIDSVKEYSALTSGKGPK